MDLDRIHSNSHDVVRSDSVLSAAAVVEIETGAGETIYIYIARTKSHTLRFSNGRTNQFIPPQPSLMEPINQHVRTHACFENVRSSTRPFPFPSLHVTSRLSLARSLSLAET